MKKLLNPYTKRLLETIGALNMQPRKSHFTSDELIDLLEKNESDICQSDILLAIVYAIKDLEESLNGLSDELRGYDP
jgi:hypothetical protein